MDPSGKHKILPYQNKDLEDLDGEIWKDIPGLESYGMISNRGRVKRLAFELYRSDGKLYRYEERIQAQKVTTYFNKFKQDSGGHLNSRIQIGGVCHSLSIGRIVYYCFVEKFDLSDHSIYISYKDYNRLNPIPDNLFRTDLSGLQQHIIKAGRKDLHFGHSAENQEVFSERGRQASRKKIHQYDMQGHYVATYDSVTAAVEHTGVGLSHISAAARGSALTAGGYIWRFGRRRAKVAVKDIHAAIRATKGTPVSRYDMHGNKIATYYNITQAAKAIGVQRESLRNAVHGKILILSGSVWRKGEAKRIDTARERQSAALRRGYILSQYTPEGIRVVTFSSSKEAAEYAGVAVERINAMTIRDDLLLDGFIWRYGNKDALPAAEVDRIRHNIRQEKRKDVTQYDLTGRRIGHFMTMTEAAGHTELNLGSIVGSVNGYKATGGGFIWRRGDGPLQLDIPETPRPLGNRLIRGVSQYSMEGKLLRSYATIAEASRETGIHKTNISNVTTGRIRSAGGYLWKTQGG